MILRQERERERVADQALAQALANRNCLGAGDRSCAKLVEPGAGCRDRFEDARAVLPLANQARKDNERRSRHSGPQTEESSC